MLIFNKTGWKADRAKFSCSVLFLCSYIFAKPFQKLINFEGTYILASFASKRFCICFYFTVFPITIVLLFVYILYDEILFVIDRLSVMIICLWEQLVWVSLEKLIKCERAHYCNFSFFHTYTSCIHGIVEQGECFTFSLFTIYNSV